MTWRPLRDPEGPAPVRVGDGLDAVLRRAGGATAPRLVSISARWEEAVGPSVSAHARPLGLRGTTLVVGVDGPAYATQLRLLSSQLIGRLSEFTGPGVIEAVEVRVRG